MFYLNIVIRTIRMIEEKNQNTLEWTVVKLFIFVCVMKPFERMAF